MQLTLVSPEQAVAAIPAGSRVLSTSYAATPDTLLRALGDVSRSVPGLTLMAGLCLGDHPFLPAVVDGSLAYRTWHVGAPVRKLVRSGEVQYVPMRAGRVPAWLGRAGEFDVLMVRLSTPDARGMCSMGPSVSWTRAALDVAPLVIAELDPAFPRTCGDTLVHVSEINIAVESQTPVPEYVSAPGSELTDRIAASIVELLPKDPVVQLGIGAVPEAVAGALADAGLGSPRVVGLGCDTMIGLVEGSAGWVARNGQAILKSVELMGTAPLYALADGNPAIEMVPSSRCHDPLWISSFPNFVSVNSAVEIDLTGQVASETLGGSVISGVGGSADFFEGANLSNGGLRIVAVQASTADGKTSKIVRSLAEGTPVTLGRHSVDVVVTEFGVARLLGLSLRERAEALSAVAAPAFRDSLLA